MKLDLSTGIFRLNIYTNNWQKDWTVHEIGSLFYLYFFAG